MHKVTFLPDGVTVEVLPEHYPYGRTGVPGSILDIALSHGVHIDNACGGAGVCGTCMVEIVEGMDHLSECTEDELDTIERQPDNTRQSRLACQAVVGGDVAVRVRRD